MATATTAQTLFAITQAGTGETTFFTATATATVAESYVASFSQDYHDTIVFTEELAGGFTQLTTHVGQFSEALTYNSEVSVHDTLLAGNSIPSTEQTTQLRSQRFVARNVVTSRIVIPINEVFQATNTVTFTTDSLTSHRFVATEETTVSVSYTGTYTTRFVAGNEVTGGYLSELYLETFAATNATTSVTESNESVSSTVVAADEQVGTLETFEELLDTFTGTELIVFDGSIANNVVEEEFIARDNVWAKDFDALAWVLNPQTSGLSYYDNFGFNSIAEFNGVLYATSPEGIFAINTDTDEGRFISAEIKTGFLDLGTEQNKRVSDLYVGYTATGYLETDVETYDWPQEVYTYPMEEREAGAPRNNRIKVGKGLNSRYWRFALRNLDGADFQIYDLQLNVGVSKRRL